MLDGGFEIDIEAIARNVDEAEVVSLYFPLMQKTLLVDTRTAADADPMVRVVEMVSDSTARLRSLRRLRPQLPRPESITLIPWLRRVRSLNETGVWGHLLARLDGCGGPQCVEAAARCLEELEALERAVFRDAIAGDGHHTLWGRRGPGDEAASA